MQTPLPSSQSHWRALAVDLDGTLIGWDHKINDPDLAALRTARLAGFHIALCTGRNSIESAGIISALNLPSPLGLGVFANGAMIADMDTGQAVHSQFLPDDLVAEAIDFFGSRGHAVLVLGDNPVTRLPLYGLTSHGPAHLATTDWLAWNRAHAEPMDFLKPEFLGRTVRVGCVTSTQESPALHAGLQSQFGARAASHSIYSPHYDCQILELFRHDVNKWTGLERLAHAMNFSPTQIITIGDDINDIPMLQNAQLSFAMGSALPEIQAHAKRLTLPQKSCGVAHVVELLLSGQLESL